MTANDPVTRLDRNVDLLFEGFDRVFHPVEESKPHKSAECANTRLRSDDRAVFKAISRSQPVKGPLSQRAKEPLLNMEISTCKGERSSSKDSYILKATPNDVSIS